MSDTQFSPGDVVYFIDCGVIRSGVLVDYSLSPRQPGSVLSDSKSEPIFQLGHGAYVHKVYKTKDKAQEALDEIAGSAQKS